LARFPDRLDLDPLRVEISTHSFEPLAVSGTTRIMPDPGIREA
jgi:hypothetical protein